MKPDKLRVTFIEAIDQMIDDLNLQLSWRIKKLRNVSRDFDFLAGSKITPLDEKSN